MPEGLPPQFRQFVHRLVGEGSPKFFDAAQALDTGYLKMWGTAQAEAIVLKNYLEYFGSSMPPAKVNSLEGCRRRARAQAPHRPPQVAAPSRS